MSVVREYRAELGRAIMAHDGTIDTSPGLPAACLR